jgi:hypothetical protein
MGENRENEIRRRRGTNKEREKGRDRRKWVKIRRLRQRRRSDE